MHFFCPSTSSPGKRFLPPFLFLAILLALLTSVSDAKPFAVKFDTAKPLGIKLSPELAVNGFARDPKDRSKMPAEKSGWLRVGDALVEVNGQRVAGMPLPDVQQLIARASIPKELVFEPANGGDRGEELAHRPSSEEGMHGHPVRLQLFRRGALLKASSKADSLLPFSIHGLQAMFGGPISCTPLLGAQFAVAKPLHGCFSHRSRESSVAGKIVIAFRGDCLFGDKAVLAQDSGAAGLLVINDDKDEPDEVLRMPWNPDSSFKQKDLSLPVAMISYRDGLSLLKYLANGTANSYSVAEDAGPRGRKDRTQPQTLKVGSDGLFLSKLSGFAGPSEVKGRLILTEHGHLCPSSLTASPQEGGKFSSRLLAGQLKEGGAEGSQDEGSGTATSEASSLGDPLSPSGILLLFAPLESAHETGDGDGHAATPFANAHVDPPLSSSVRSPPVYQEPSSNEEDVDGNPGHFSWLSRLARRYRSKLPPSWFKRQAEQGQTPGAADDKEGASAWKSLQGAGLVALSSAALHRGEYLCAQQDPASLSPRGLPRTSLPIVVPGGPEGQVCQPSSSEHASQDQAHFEFGCISYSLPASLVGSAAVLVRRGGGCSFADKVKRAEQAGARAIIIGNEDLSQPLIPIRAFNSSIPSVLVSSPSHSTLLSAACASVGDKGHHEVAFVGDDGSISRAWASLADLRWPSERKKRRKLYLSLSRENHPDRETGDTLRFDFLVNSYERVAYADGEGGDGQASLEEPLGKDEL